MRKKPTKVPRVTYVFKFYRFQERCLTSKRVLDAGTLSWLTSEVRLNGHWLLR